jgi:hypothetical protein
VLKSPCKVHVEKPGVTLGDIMNDIRLWLDGHKIEPVGFITIPVDQPGAAFDIKFQHEEEAELFDQAFA